MATSTSEAKRAIERPLEINRVQHSTTNRNILTPSRSNTIQPPPFCLFRWQSAFQRLPENAGSRQQAFHNGTVLGRRKCCIHSVYRQNRSIFRTHRKSFHSSGTTSEMIARVVKDPRAQCIPAGVKHSPTDATSCQHIIRLDPYAPGYPMDQKRCDDLGRSELARPHFRSSTDDVRHWKIRDRESQISSIFPVFHPKIQKPERARSPFRSRPFTRAN